MESNERQGIGIENRLKGQMEQSILIRLVQLRKVDYPERWTHFSKLSRLERANPLSFRLKFPDILAEWIMP